MSSSKHRDEAEKNRITASTLYLVATPIGNMSDISYRAVKVLSGVDFIAAEDTRNTARLLSALDISKPMLSYHEHNKRSRGIEILERLRGGESCALVSDAGTPAISDPGAELVCECIDAGICVTCVPGACAAITALTLSGMDTRRFVFEGFLAASGSERKKRLTELSSESRTVVIYEAPHKLRNTLADLREFFGNRRIALCRELTKLNEDVFRADIEAALQKYTDQEPRGEYVLVVEGASDDGSQSFWSEMSINEHIAFYIGQGMTKMDAIKKTARDRGVSKNEIYKETIR